MEQNNYLQNKLLTLLTGHEVGSICANSTMEKLVKKLERGDDVGTIAEEDKSPPPKKPRTVVQSLNNANTALKKKYKALTDKTEAAEEMFTQQVTAKEYAHVLRTREYKKILDEAGQVDFIPHVLEAVCEGHIPPDHIWYKYNRFAWHNCTLSCMCARMPVCIHAGMHASAFDSARRL